MQASTGHTMKMLTLEQLDAESEYTRNKIQRVNCTVQKDTLGHLIHTIRLILTALVTANSWTVLFKII